MELTSFRGTNRFKIKSVAIIDGDSHFQNSTRDYCHDLKIDSVTLFSDCASAWSEIKNGSFDLIILDWLCKGELNPIGLFNRIKNSSSTLFTPVLITAGFTERHDFRLLQEFPLVTLMEKPFTAGVFYQTVKGLQDERVWYLRNTKKLNQMLERSVNIKAIRKHLEFIVNESPNPAPLAAVYGKVLRQQERYTEAEEVLRFALGVNSQHVALLNEIGKLYHVTGSHKKALRYLKRAGSLSPDNTKRLCLIGELELGECRPLQAKDSFQAALDIDPWYMRAKEGVGLSRSVDKFFQSHPDEPSTNSNFASLMNTIGISNVRSGELDEGIKHYNSALKFIEDSSTKAKVMFNIGLGYLRHNDIRNALLWFMRSSKAGIGMYDKANPYVNRLSDMFVLTDGSESVAEEPFPDQPMDYQENIPEKDDLDDLFFDDFDDDDIVEFSDADEFDDESLLGT